MKKVITALFLLAFMASGARADSIDDALGTDTSPQVRESVREMVRAGIHQDDAIGITRAMVLNRYQERNVLQVHQSVREARRAGLPTEPLMNKLREGIAKQVRSEAVAKAVDQVRAGTRMHTARQRALPC